jgi:hypothetical protein
VPSYYDYSEARVAPSALLTFLGSGIALRTTYEFAVRAYSGRLAQNSDGTYTSARLAQYSSTLSAEASYPLASSLDAKLQASWSSSSSNNRYEQVYRYNYSSSNYFGGLEWRF